MNNDPEVLEIVQRVRRIETRLTQSMIALGIDTAGQKPVFHKAPGEHPEITLPSPHSSIREILAAIPDKHKGDQCGIFLGPDHLANITKL